MTFENLNHMKKLTELQQIFKDYIESVNKLYKTGNAREHSYRGSLETFIEKILNGYIVVNEPAHIKCGAPDYYIAKDVKGEEMKIPVAFIEAKDIGDKDLDGVKATIHKEQFDRYKKDLKHIVFTDYLDFHFYEDGCPTGNVRIGEVKGENIVPLTENLERFASMIKSFASCLPQPLDSPEALASVMASKARLIAREVRSIFNQPKADDGREKLEMELEGFKSTLIESLTPSEYADIYAQTITYGLFAARLDDPTPETFSREEAAMLIGKSNPFLRGLFKHIAMEDLDERIAWIVDDLVLAFRATDLKEVLKEYTGDAITYFYEDFLFKYNPEQKKSRGVWYTPQEVVSFMVRSVDKILQTEFSIPNGLADDSKVIKEVPNPQYDKSNRKEKKMIKTEFRRVQILDPATGTGTYLAETVRCVYDKFKNKKGMWPSYVKNSLLPRLNGFELLMTSYTIAHIRLNMLLNEIGYVHDDSDRLRVYLTNSLENHKGSHSIFLNWLASETIASDRIKREQPVMVLIGNPPYNGESKNKGEWIMELMKDYKKEPGGKKALNEKNPKWINDDYVKFIRLGQHYIERNNEGVMAYINPHGFIDNPTFRGVRWQLMKSFDRIYIINLHGNSKRGEACPDGSKDENVFDIQQGVSINFFVKTGEKGKDELGKVYYADLYGTRKYKAQYLKEHGFDNVEFCELKPEAPMYFFTPKDFELSAEYMKGFAVNELFIENSVGIVTTKDKFLVCDTKEEVQDRIRDLIELPEQELRDKYGLTDSRDWSIARAKADVGKSLKEDCITTVDYRPFDRKFLYYTGKTNGIVARPRCHVMFHLLNPRNLALMTCRQTICDEWSHVGVTDAIMDDCRVSNKTKERGYIYPLYLSNGETVSVFEENPSNLKPNLSPSVVRKIEGFLGSKLSPEEIFDYIYAVLHSPTYRSRYQEFLKTDFPRIPYPTNKEGFELLVKSGTLLRELHLMKDKSRMQQTGTFNVSGNNLVEELSYRDYCVYINKTQYFGEIPERAWNFFIGGYQPAQKWLKDRKGKILNNEDIDHYMYIIRVLEDTADEMVYIDDVLFNEGNIRKN